MSISDTFESDGDFGEHRVSAKRPLVKGISDKVAAVSTVFSARNDWSLSRARDDFTVE